MTIDEMKARIAALSESISAQEDERRELKRSLASAVSAFKVGDRVTKGDGSVSWEITDVSLGWRDTANYFGAKLKKDGTPVKHVGRLYLWTNESFRLVSPVTAAAAEGQG